MYLFKRIVFDCKRATLLSIKREEGRITFFEKIKLSYHLLYCDPCRQFIDQSKQIGQIGKELNQMLYMRPPFTLPEVTKDRIQQQIDQLDR
jgi:hypothetical protein